MRSHQAAEGESAHDHAVDIQDVEHRYDVFGAVGDGELPGDRQSASVATLVQADNRMPLGQRWQQPEEIDVQRPGPPVQQQHRQYTVPVGPGLPHENLPAAGDLQHTTGRQLGTPSLYV